MSLSSDIYLVNGQTAAHGQARIIHCNGIETDPEKAMAQGLLISRAFNGREVMVIHNPTRVIGSVDDGVYGYFARHSEGQIGLEQKIAKTLAEQIRTQIGPEKFRLVVFAHSHGTQILFRALQELDENERNLIEVHGMSGIVSIPKKLASKVVNHFNEGDIIGIKGNRAFDSNDTIRQCIKIKKDMQLNGVGLRRAIMNKAIRDIEKNLDPLKLDKNVTKEERNGAVGIYCGTFFGGTPIPQDLVKPILDKYIRCFQDYSIDWKPSSSQINSVYEDDDLTNIAEETIEALKTFMTDSDEKCHMLNSFSGEIQRIAAQIISEEQK